MDEQQLQQQIVQLVQAAMQGDEQATQQIQQIMQAAQQGDQQATQLAQMIQYVAQQMQQQQVQAAKFGAKLNYIKQLRGVCPDGYEMQYFKRGGRFCKQCVAKQKKMEQRGMAPSGPVDAFKCGRKMKKKACGGKMKKSVKKAENGSFINTPTGLAAAMNRTAKQNYSTLKNNNQIQFGKCGMKKKACGGLVKKDQQGGTVQTVKIVTTYPKRLKSQRRDVQYFSDGTQAVLNGGWGTDGMYRASLRGRRGEFGNTAGTPLQQQIADSLLKVDWNGFGRGPVEVPPLNKTSRTK